MMTLGMTRLVHCGNWRQSLQTLHTHLNGRFQLCIPIFCEKACSGERSVLQLVIFDVSKDADVCFITNLISAWY